MSSDIDFTDGQPLEDQPLPNVVFLDMDGVLCTPRACVAVGDTGGVYRYLDPIACLLLKRLCEENNAKIVVSSAWRVLHTRQGFIALLGAACPGLGRFIWEDDVEWRTASFIHTDELGRTSDRGREIHDWIKRHDKEYTRFVILDDMMDMRPLDYAHVLCNIDDGLSLRNFYEAAATLTPSGE